MWRQGFTDGVIARDWPHLLLDFTGLGIIPTTPEGVALYLESWRTPGILSPKRWLGKSRIQNLVIGKLIRFFKKHTKLLRPNKTSQHSLQGRRKNQR